MENNIIVCLLFVGASKALLKLSRLAWQREEVRDSVVQDECSSLRRDQPFQLGCGPGDNGNEAVLAIVATK